MSVEVVTKDEIQTYLFNLLSTEKNIASHTIALDKELKQLDIDSFGFLEVIFSIEHQYSISFPKNYEHIRTVQDVIDITYALVSEKIVLEKTVAA